MSQIKVVATNRRARHDYFLHDTFEGGLALLGSEIKSIRAGQINLRQSYVGARGNELYLMEAHIAPYDPASSENHEPTRPRKLLLKRREINRILAKTADKGTALIPMRVYLVRGRAKLEFAIGRGKKKYDKRAAIAERDAKRQMERDFARRNRG